MDQTETSIDVDGSVHTQIYEAEIRRRRRHAETGHARNMPPPEDVARKVQHALESPAPKSRYLVTRDAILIAWLVRLLPSWAIDQIFLRQLRRRAERDGRD